MHEYGKLSHPHNSRRRPNETSHADMILVHELTKRFVSGRHTVLAVDRLSFEVAPGEVYGLLGPNGAGKTTTLRMIVGLIPPDAGYAEVGGFRVQRSGDEVKRRIGCVTSTDGLYPWLTVRETLQFFADLYDVPSDIANENIRRLAKLFQIEELLDRRSYYLSTGQKQRAILARGLVHDPPTMLLDEPTRGLDVIGSQTVFEYVRHLRLQGKAVVLSTHRLDEAARLCTRFGLLHKGHLRHEGTLAELQQATGQQSLVDMFRQLTDDAAALASGAVD